jgi:hypothetical protein
VNGRSNTFHRAEWFASLGLLLLVGLLAYGPGTERPLDRSEWLPFLEGYVVAGWEDQAAEIASRLGYDEKIRHGLCDAIATVPAPGFSPENQEDLLRALCE